MDKKDIKMAKQLSAIEARKLQEVMIDPVKWAQIFVTIFDNASKKKTPWIARWYQAEMLEDRSVKKVARCGRRTGKCLTGDTTIVDTETGEPIAIKDLYLKQQARFGTMDDDYTIQKHFTNIILDNGIKDVFKMTTESGRSIRATGNHPFFTVDGWKDIDNLKVGDSVAVAANTRYFGRDFMNKDVMDLLVYILTFGSLTTSGNFLEMAICNESILTRLRDICKKNKIELIESNDKYYIGKRDKSFKKLLTWNRLEVSNIGDRIDKQMYRLNETDLAYFINKMLLTANSSCLNGRTTYSFKNDNISKEIQHILLRTGINSCIGKRPGTLIVDSHGNDRSIEKIPQKIAKHIITTAIINGEGLSEDLSKDFTKAKLKEISTRIGSEDLYNLADSDLIFEKIVSITYEGEEKTYDFSVPITNNFIANDFITHNTETMCIEMLWKAYTKPYHRILVVTPYENQVRLIFTRLMEIINDSPLLKQKIKKSTKNPYWIEFDNGAIILGFTTGAASGSGGASIRGQRADAIYLDEVD